MWRKTRKTLRKHSDRDNRYIFSKIEVLIGDALRKTYDDILLTNSSLIFNNEPALDYTRQ